MTGVNVGNNAVASWGVGDIEAAYRQLLERGAEPRDPVTDVGGDIKVATIADPFGNVIGLIQNPHFAARAWIPPPSVFLKDIGDMEAPDDRPAPLRVRHGNRRVVPHGRS